MSVYFSMLMQVEHLSVGFGQGNSYCEIVSDISFTVPHGAISALVGESGCGKSMTCLSLGGLLPPAAVVKCDSMMLDAGGGNKVDLSNLSTKERRKYNGCGIAYIFQEPATSLNPVFTVASQIDEALRLHTDLDRKGRSNRTIELLERVGIPDPTARAKAYPHELSGGMQQRVMIAIALAGNPRLLIADEPTTALDVTIQAQILELLRDLASTTGMGILLVTHNLGIVAQMAEEVNVMYAGRIVERAKTSELISNPIHPYTVKLLRAVPLLRSKKEKLETIPGTVPRPDAFPVGCRFANRCEFAVPACRGVQQLTETNPGHWVACHVAGCRNASADNSGDR